LLRWLSFSKKLKKLFVDVLVCLVFKEQLIISLKSDFIILPSYQLNVNNYLTSFFKNVVCFATTDINIPPLILQRNTFFNLFVQYTKIIIFKYLLAEKQKSTSCPVLFKIILTMTH